MKFAVFGCGMMASALIYDLVQDPGIELVYACDISYLKARAMEDRFPGVKAVEVDISDANAVAEILKDVDTALGFASYHYNYELSRIAIETKTNFCDLGGNNTVVKQQFTLNEKAKENAVTIVPDCGLAPGMVNILTANGCNNLDVVEEVKIRVGGLPLDRNTSPIGYSIFFSVRGLINEYVEPVSIIRNWKQETIEPLTEIEEIEFPAPYGI
ncbi:MAG: saccharopine dehydrogenase NADP-binding domain-containing protein, partial [Candidatus Eremiobacteraeota bacterium]|nr:saccharopine dehydrogenase NADP-binding domain-containing protein [Candidatus Eremiobacteraeota bacterium]